MSRKTEAQRRDERSRRLAYGEGGRERRERARFFEKLSGINGLYYVRLRLCRQTAEEYRREQEAWAREYPPSSPRVAAYLGLLNRREELERECGMDPEAERVFERNLVDARRVHRRITGEDVTPAFVGSENVAERLEAYDGKLLERLDYIYGECPELVYEYHCGMFAPRGRFLMPGADFSRFQKPDAERVRRERQDARSRSSTAAQKSYEDFGRRVARRTGVPEERIEQLRSLRHAASLTHEYAGPNVAEENFDSIPF